MSVRNSFSLGSSAVALLGAVALLAFAGRASGSELPPPVAAEPASLEAEGADPADTGNAIVVRHADEADYFSESGWIHARGNVVVAYGDQTLRADSIKINTAQREAFAEGNVVLTRGDGETWRGDSLRHDFEAKITTIERVVGESEPFRLLDSEKIERDKDNRFIVYNCRITTCEHDLPRAHYHVRARKVIVAPGRYLKIYGARWYFGAAPVMYFPYWKRNLKDRFGFNLQPGYRSREGYFALGSYSFPLGEFFKGETRLDYRTRRGWAVGQDVVWRDAAAGWGGDISVYYAADQEPDAGMPPGETSDIPSDRSRVRLRHRHAVTPRDTVRVQAHWLSDRDMLEDFFVREYRRSRQPENFAVYTRRGDTYIADLLLRGRMNDFYSEVQRLPELSVRFFRREIGDSRIFYESQSAAARLERVWAASNTNDLPYALSRIDSGHMLYRPRKVAGFLQVVPRAGYRLTWYSQTRETRNIWLPAEDGSLEPVSATVDRGADVRSQFQVGTEASFKAYKSWVGGVVSPLRHVVEPYADYTWAPEPTLAADNIYQFDRVDSLAKNHSVKLGVRNKWQTKVENVSHDLIDLDLYTRARLETEPAQDVLDPFFFDLRIRPTVKGWSLNLDGAYNPYDATLDRFNAETDLELADLWKASLEFRIRREESALLFGNVLLMPNKAWNFGVGGRYEFETERLEEVEGLVARFWDCMVLRTRVGFAPGYERADGRTREDDWRIAVEFWLTAFPEVRLLSR